MQTTGEENPTPQTPLADGEIDYSNAPGSGTASILLFLQVALTGYLAYLAIAMLAPARQVQVFSPAAGWQLAFPIFLGIFSFFPTDSLTRFMGQVTRWTAFATLALSAILAIVHGLIKSSLLPIAVEKQIPVQEVVGVALSAWLGGFLAGCGASLLFRMLLPGHSPKCTETMESRARFVLFLSSGMMLVLAGNHASRYATLAAMKTQVLYSLLAVGYVGGLAIFYLVKNLVYPGILPVPRITALLLTLVGTAGVIATLVVSTLMIREPVQVMGLLGAACIAFMLIGNIRRKFLPREGNSTEE